MDRASYVGVPSSETVSFKIAQMGGGFDVCRMQVEVLLYKIFQNFYLFMHIYVCVSNKLVVMLLFCSYLTVMSS